MTQCQPSSTEQASASTIRGKGLQAKQAFQPTEVKSASGRASLLRTAQLRMFRTICAPVFLLLPPYYRRAFQQALAARHQQFAPSTSFRPFQVRGLVQIRY